MLARQRHGGKRPPNRKDRLAPLESEPIVSTVIRADIHHLSLRAESSWGWGGKGYSQMLVLDFPDATGARGNDARKAIAGPRR